MEKAMTESWYVQGAAPRIWRWRRWTPPLQSQDAAEQRKAELRISYPSVWFRTTRVRREPPKPRTMAELLAGK